MASLAVAGCGGDEDRTRDDVERFVRQANAVQSGNSSDLNRANRAYLSFSKGKLPPKKAQRELARAEQSMRETRDRLAALAAPPAARELQRRLVALFDADAALAHESTLLASFVPAQEKASAPLPGIARRLSRSLAGADGPQQQERALRRYAARVRGVIAALQPLQPPPLLVDRHHAQLERLRTVRQLALQLASALKKQDGGRVARLLLRFRNVSAQPAGATLGRVAVKAYNERYLAVRGKLQSVEAERRRLDKELD